MSRIATIDVPQANTLALVGELLALVDAGITDKPTLSERLGVDTRQVDYYEHAARILDFGDFKGSKFVLTDRGRAYLKAKRPTEKFAMMSEAVRDSEVFRRLLHHYTEAELSRENISDFLRHATHLTGATVPRRADSIVAWVKAICKFDPESFASIAEHADAKAADDFHAYKDHEEGQLHHMLKMGIAEQPELLGEPLKLIKIEYAFPTNDRADLLFLDAKARFLAVEVEVDVGALDIAGLLQAAKYKAMVRVQFGRGANGVRGMLAARNIHPVMQERAERHELEAKEVKGVI